MNILGTGGSGYIGSVMVEEPIGQGQRVTILDNLSQGHRPAVHPEAEFVLGDLAGTEILMGTRVEILRRFRIFARLARAGKA